MSDREKEIREGVKIYENVLWMINHEDIKLLLSTIDALRAENDAMRKAIVEVLNSNAVEIKNLIHDYEFVGQDNYISVRISLIRKLIESVTK